MAHLPFMLERREDVRPPQKLEVSFGRVAADLLQQGLETNHTRRCLTPQGVVLQTGSACVCFMIAGGAALHVPEPHSAGPGWNLRPRTLDGVENGSLYLRAYACVDGSARPIEVI